MKMENFQYYNPTKLLFGNEILDQICVEALNFGKKAILIIGANSVKKSGLYARIISLMNISGIEHITFEGIKPNPVYQDADEAICAAKDFDADVIIAIGGGSVIDTAKAVAMGYYVNHSVWDFYCQKVPKPVKALPIICALTIAATGTEMNSSTVLQDTENGMKKGYSAPCLFPKVSFLDPNLTFTVPLNYTAYGVADLISHALEQYFGFGESELSDHYTAAVIKLAVKYGKEVMVKPDDYQVRANLMWLATNALNGTLKAGKNSGDWGVHGIEHSLSVLYNIPHGAGLSITYPAWLKFHKKLIVDKLSFLAKEVFGFYNDDKQVTADYFISTLESFFITIKTPVRLSEVNIIRHDRDLIVKNLKLNKVNGSVYKLSDDDYGQLIDHMW